MKVYDILTESGIKHLSKEEVMNHLQNDFSEAFEEAQNHHFLYRGFGDMDIVYDLLQPMRGRRSSNTNNFYTLIMNNSPRFESLPKRSVITSTSRINAGHYSHNDASFAIVLPKNGTKLGVVPVMDIWQAPVEGLGPTTEGFYKWGRILERILSEFMYPNDIKSYDDLLKAHDDFMNYISNEENYEKMENMLKYMRIYTLSEDFIYRVLSEGLKYYYSLLDPNIFKTVSVSGIGSIADNKEVWFDEEFIAINVLFIGDFLG